MIFVLFLVSVGVMELVLKVNARKTREKLPAKVTKPAEVPSADGPSITPDLLSLAKAIRAEAPQVESALVPADRNLAEYNRKDAPAE